MASIRRHPFSKMLSLAGIPYNRRDRALCINPMPPDGTALTSEHALAVREAWDATPRTESDHATSIYISSGVALTVPALRILLGTKKRPAPYLLGIRWLRVTGRSVPNDPDFWPAIIEPLLAGAPRLTGFDLSGIPLTVALVRRLLPLLTRTPQHLHFNNCNITNKVAVCLANEVIIHHPRTILTLSLNGNPSIGHEGCHALGRALSFCYFVQAVEVHGLNNEESPEAIQRALGQNAKSCVVEYILEALGEVLKLHRAQEPHYGTRPHATHLHNIDVGCNIVTNTAARTLASVASGSHLVRLNAERCFESHRDCLVVVDAIIPHGSRLQVLVLDGNPLGMMGVMRLEGLLRNKNDLRKLGLRSCLLGDDGVHFLLDQSRYCDDMARLDLGNNGLTPSGWALFLEPAHRYRNLRWLNLAGNNYEAVHPENVAEVEDRYPCDLVIVGRPDVAQISESVDDDEEDGHTMTSPLPPRRRCNAPPQVEAGGVETVTQIDTVQANNDTAEAEPETVEADTETVEAKAEDDTADESGGKEDGGDGASSANHEFHNLHDQYRQEALHFFEQAINGSNSMEYARLGVQHFPFLYHMAMRSLDRSSNIPPILVDAILQGIVDEDATYITEDQWVGFWVSFRFR